MTVVSDTQTSDDPTYRYQTVATSHTFGSLVMVGTGSSGSSHLDFYQLVNMIRIDKNLRREFIKALFSEAE